MRKVVGNEVVGIGISLLLRGTLDSVRDGASHAVGYKVEAALLGRIRLELARSIGGAVEREIEAAFNRLMCSGIRW